MEGGAWLKGKEKGQRWWKGVGVRVYSSLEQMLPLRICSPALCVLFPGGWPCPPLQLVDQAGFKDEHLCWGQVADMSLFDKIVTLPRREKKAGEMNE